MIVKIRNRERRRQLTQTNWHEMCMNVPVCDLNN